MMGEHGGCGRGSRPLEPGLHQQGARRAAARGCPAGSAEHAEAGAQSLHLTHCGFSVTGKQSHPLRIGPRGSGPEEKVLLLEELMAVSLMRPRELCNPT